MELFFAVILVVFGIVIAKQMHLNSLNKKFIEKHKNCKYIHAHDGSGMAVDVDNRKVSLFYKKNEVSYNYEDIREWSYNIESAGRIYGGGVAAAQANTANSIAAVKNSGFFVKVRDIDNPLWRISFPHSKKKMKAQLERWLEIFNQAVGENRV